MAEPPSHAPRPSRFALYDSPRTEAITGIEVAAAILSVLWMVATAVLLLAVPGGPDDGSFGPLRVLLAAMAFVLPVAMIWVAAMAVRSSRVMREESQRLQAAIDALRQAYVAQNQSGLSADGTLMRKLEEIAAATRTTQAAPAPRPAPRAAGPAATRVAPQADDQATLALGPASEPEPPLPSEDFIQALNFPETAEDREGFAALRRALRDRTAGQLIQAAQDVLTLLSHEGVYMDDLTPDRARPEIWRNFAKGARGRSISGLGGIRDEAALARAAGRMKQDPIFRDAAHHFLRKFDHTFALFEETASDAEISALADTRTARAFMLLGRVAGTFD